MRLFFRRSPRGPGLPLNLDNSDLYITQDYNCMRDGRDIDGSFDDLYGETGSHRRKGRACARASDSNAVSGFTEAILFMMGGELPIATLRRRSRPFHTNTVKTQARRADAAQNTDMKQPHGEDASRGAFIERRTAFSLPEYSTRSPESECFPRIDGQRSVLMAETFKEVQACRTSKCVNTLMLRRHTCRFRKRHDPMTNARLFATEYLTHSFSGLLSDDERVPNRSNNFARIATHEKPSRCFERGIL